MTLAEQWQRVADLQEYAQMLLELCELKLDEAIIELRLCWYWIHQVSKNVNEIREYTGSRRRSE